MKTIIYSKWGHCPSKSTIWRKLKNSTRRNPYKALRTLPGIFKYSVKYANTVQPWTLDKVAPGKKAGGFRGFNKSLLK